MMKPEIAEEQELIRRQIWQLAREIPSGRVISYGALGKRSEPPISGYICGRIMALAMKDVPWWRVVGKDGKLPIGKRGPENAARQRELLREEGVEFDENGAILRRFFDD
ncbi:methylated-DNA-protein-cysteine methyltransferase related protein [Abditibacterium utsteinense]|uniref:Methylated-DNA-protein-cysteine methyltransferase related protein n=1 Tax=Abditibacterium utsteinense TaxID=1960156 RepID=A0A2S8SWF1_9BACT|nr:MGMT family protein [Abditibacterium utsteinense]PQV65123.1 methylated-DNA-protein-cysteine methyltransferase related protein [Abditibacterium utsteinense]